MISYLSGTVAHAAENFIIIEVSGIGYQVQVLPSAIAKLPPNSETIKIFTYMQVKEDGIVLYGFLLNEELEVFRDLIGVSGVGPKAAQNLLAVMTPQQLALAIITGDVAALAKAPGIGRKTAERVALELRDRVRTKDAVAEAYTNPQQTIGTRSEKQDAIDALLALGYTRTEALKAVMEAALPEMNAERIIKAALKKLTQ
ncbi:MAG: Holliday junction branch migration protein RuvA [Clostridiales bacterium]|jgi:Holliday junction DNA helicase RuvA|nr:Holliday junction branch migration protein RuvA [Clostridiales bacterium]